MVKKAMSYVAIAAFALTVGVKVVNAAYAPDYTYVYLNNGDSTTETPRCAGSMNECALVYEYDENADDFIGAIVIDPLTGVQKVILGNRF